MNVLLLSLVFPPDRGGSGRWLWELYRRLPSGDASRPFGVHVVTGPGGRTLADPAGQRELGPPPDIAAFDAASPIPITRIPLEFTDWGLLGRGGAQYLRALRGLRRVIARTRPDAIHCGKCLPEGVLGAVVQRWHRIPFTCYVHGEELTLAGTSKELTVLSRFVLHQASTVVANSGHTKQMLLEKWRVPAERVVVMHPGVDTTAFTPAVRDEAVRARLGWTNRRVVLTVGALQKRKGQDMMIRALPAVRARCPDVLYAIAGEGWERTYLNGLVEELGVQDAVQFRRPPQDRELVECYQQCDLFALPNRQVGWDLEGFGIVLIEAEACGRPVVAGRSGGTADTMSVPATGELVSCDSPEPLAQMVADLLEDAGRREAMGACGRQWAVEHFDWSVLTAQARRIFEQRNHP